jgi:hypothetical protein
MIRRPLLAAALLASVSTAALAQSRQPAQISTLPASTPQEFDLLDKAGVWTPIGFASNGVFSNLDREISLSSFGAYCDGAHDDTAAIQNWLNKADPNTRLTAPAGVCLFSYPVYGKHAVANGGNLTVSGAGPDTTNFRYTGPDYNGFVTAGAAYAANATTITLSSSTLPANVAAALAAGYNITAFDATSGKFMAQVQSIVGTTLTLKYGTPFASSGASDSIHLTTDLMTFGTMGAGVLLGALFTDFNITSTTPLTGGFALRLFNPWNFELRSVWLDSSDGVTRPDRGNLCGGLWIDGGVSGSYSNPNMYSLQNCGDAILVNSRWGASPGTAEFLVRGGNIGGTIDPTTKAISGFLNGFHMGGGFGGFRCDGTNVHNESQYGLLIDNAYHPAQNREFNQGSTCAFDTPGKAGVYLNDVGSLFIDLAGWVASTVAGDGVVVNSMPNGLLNLDGESIGNNCGSGVHVNDPLAAIRIAPTLILRNNGTTFGGVALCTAWQAANPGHGFGVSSSVATSNIFTDQTPVTNAAGNWTANTGLKQLTPTAYKHASGGIGGVLTVEEGSTNLIPGGLDQSSAYWTMSGVTAAGNSVESPDGSTNAALLTTTGAATAGFYSSVTGKIATLTPLAPYTTSLMLKAGSTPLQYGWLALKDDTDTSDLRVSFDLVNCVAIGTFVKGSGVVSASGAYLLKGPNGDWCRVYVTGTYNSAQGNIVLAFTDTLALLNTFTSVYSGGAGKTVSAWGAQVNPGNLTSFIPTAAAAAVRPAGTPMAKLNATGLTMNGVAGFSGTKTAGSCVMTIANGVITNVTGC